jgi:NAD(P)H dehydrogenase (quinone)
MPLFAITGITGQVGGAAARRLLTAGASVRGVVRDAARGAPWREAGARVAVANLDDASALAAAFDGADGVFIMTPSWGGSRDMFARNIRAIDALGVALRAVRPPRIVLLSSIGAQHPAGTGAILKLHRMEQAFAGIAGVVSVRAGWFMENYAGLIPQVWASGVLPSMLAPLDRAQPMVATQDIGEAVATLLLSPEGGPSVIELEGPRRYAPNDVATAFAEVLGRPVTAEILPPSRWPAIYAQRGLTPRSAEAMAEMLAGFNSGHIAFETADTVCSRTSLEAVLAAAERGPRPLRDHVASSCDRDVLV